MNLTIFYLRAAKETKSQPVFVPISGDFDGVGDAKLCAIATATRNPNFREWCVAFDIQDRNGNIVADWKADNAPRP